MTRFPAPAALLALLAGAVPAAAQDFPRLSGTHPVLVTVDDLPLASNRLHPDRGERARVTRGLLAVLRRHGIRAVGLVTWNNVDGPEGERLLEEWLAAGHELGNHSYRHLDYPRTAPEEYVADVEKARVTLESFLG